MRLLPLELKEKEIYFGGCDHRLWSQQTWIQIPSFKARASPFIAQSVCFLILTWRNNSSRGAREG